jgi:hypothetical protein
MNTRGEVLFGLTCTFDLLTAGRSDGPFSGLLIYLHGLQFHSSNECDVPL